MSLGINTPGYPPHLAAASILQSRPPRYTNAHFKHLLCRFFQFCPQLQLHVGCRRRVVSYVALLAQDECQFAAPVDYAGGKLDGKGRFGGR